MQTPSEANPAVKARAKLKSSGIAVKLSKTDGLTFIIPKHIEKDIQEKYKFNFEMLKIGGDLPLSDLAVHVDEQASMEAYIGIIAENAKYNYEFEKEKYEIWFEKICYRCRSHLLKSNKTVTEKLVIGYVNCKYEKQIITKRRNISKLEYIYRIIDRVIRSSIITKGVMLPTLRNIIQGKDGVGIGDSKVSSKLRQKLKFKRGVSQW